MKTIKPYLLTLLVLVIFGCQEDSVNIENTLAKKLNSFEKEFDLENFDDPFIKNNLAVDWNSYSINETENGTLYEFNTLLRKEQIIENGENQFYTLYKLLVTEDGEGKANMRLLKFFSNDKENLDQVDYLNMESFSGMLYCYDLDGKNTKIAVYEDGEVISEFEDKERGTINAQSKAPVAYCEDCPEGGYVLVITEHYTDYYVSWNGGDFTYSYSVYTGTTSEWVWVSGAGSSGGGSSINPTSHSHYDYPHGPSVGTNNHPDENINGYGIVFNPDNPISDVADFLECFDFNQNATITVYTNEPNPGSGDTHNGTFVGHTFVSISQGNNTSTFGFYPVEDNIYPVFNESSPSVLGDDGNGNEPFSASISTTVSGGQLQQIINFTINYNDTYHLDNYNCTDFGIDIGNLSGLSLPDSYGSWTGGGGSNPGTLGAHIRGLNSNSNITVNKTGGVAPATNKGC